MFNRDMKIAGFDDELWNAIQAEEKRQEAHIEIKHGCAAPMCLAARKNGPLFYLTNG